MSTITTHILDTSRGCPASGVPVLLEFQVSASEWREIGNGTTDGDGRLRDLLSPDRILLPGNYRITFKTGAYFARHSIEGFYPEISVLFTIRDSTQHHHVPLLLSPFGYSTYRGS